MFRSSRQIPARGRIRARPMLRPHGILVSFIEGQARVSVFVSYRREDSAGHAGRICEHLSAIFGPENVFMDVEDIAPGQDFAEAIESTISACKAVVVIIGPRWISSLDTRSGGEDFVRHEVSVALRRNVTVIPVLVGGANMPPANSLPEKLKPLARRQALEIRDSRFDDDAKLLVAALRKVRGLSPSAPGKRRERRYWALAIIIVCLGAFAFFVLRRGSAFDVSGVWIAEMSKPRQRSFRVRLNLDQREGTVAGTVTYPTGDAAVQAGRLTDGHLTFFTVHTPQFGSEPATIRWTGFIDGDFIRVTEADDSGVATGVARRAAAD